MRYFYDTEFLEDGRTIELISIGIVAEDGRELYLINREAPWERIEQDAWLMANVVSSLPHRSEWVSRDAIATSVTQFFRDDKEAELWANYAAYDFVALCQLFGRMIDLPDGVPEFTDEFQREWRRAGCPALPRQTSGLHNALEDARHLRDCFETLTASR
jgi:hypothetical protein